MLKKVGVANPAGIPALFDIVSKMSIGRNLFGGSKRSTTKNNTAASASSAQTVDLERALRFTRKPLPKYSNTKKDSIRRALLSLERAVLSIDAAQRLLEETCSLFKTANEKADELDNAKKSVLAAQVVRMNKKLSSYVEAANSEGLNLVDGQGSHLTVALSDSTTGQLIIRKVNLSPQGMGLIAIDPTCSTRGSVEQAFSLVERALDYVTTQNETFCANATILADHYQRI